jgi:hypothetical protein
MSNPIEEKKPVFVERLAVPLVAVVGAIIVLAPAFFWASNLSTHADVQSQEINELKTRMQRVEDANIADKTRLAIVETNYQSVLSALIEIKASLAKLEDKFNLK